MTSRDPQFTYLPTWIAPLFLSDFAAAAVRERAVVPLVRRVAMGSALLGAYATLAPLRGHRWSDGPSSPIMPLLVIGALSYWLLRRGLREAPSASAPAHRALLQFLSSLLVLPISSLFSVTLWGWPYALNVTAGWLASLGLCIAHSLVVLIGHHLLEDKTLQSVIQLRLLGDGYLLICAIASLVFTGMRPGLPSVCMAWALFDLLALAVEESRARSALTRVLRGAHETVQVVAHGPAFLGDDILPLTALDDDAPVFVGPKSDGGLTYSGALPESLATHYLDPRSRGWLDRWALAHPFLSPLFDAPRTLDEMRALHHDELRSIARSCGLVAGLFAAQVFAIDTSGSAPLGELVTFALLGLGTWGTVQLGFRLSLRPLAATLGVALLATLLSWILSRLVLSSIVLSSMVPDSHGASHATTLQFALLLLPLPFVARYARRDAAWESLQGLAKLRLLHAGHLLFPLLLWALHVLPAPLTYPLVLAIPCFGVFRLLHLLRQESRARGELGRIFAGTSTRMHLADDTTVPQASDALPLSELVDGAPVTLLAGPRSSDYRESAAKSVALLIPHAVAARFTSLPDTAGPPIATHAAT